MSSLRLSLVVATAAISFILSAVHSSLEFRHHYLRRPGGAAYPRSHLLRTNHPSQVHQTCRHIPQLRTKRRQIPFAPELSWLGSSACVIALDVALIIALPTAVPVERGFWL
ncbi:hypothetical protein B0H19DRAFT_603213 [Mycena capillaripes]|nr:hypothetical protein B0H19DRAFT_603213 [Mycena capillaripes]